MRELCSICRETFDAHVWHCPFCDHQQDRVVDSRESREGDVVRRRRQCLKCERRFTTYERIDEVPYLVVKKDGRREKFDRQKVLTGLPANFPSPIVLVQHMPASFTPAFAERLNKLCRIEIRQAEDGDELRPGLALLAPGGKQMMIDGRGTVKILPGDERLNYKPCVDITFGSAAKSYGDKVLSVVLTGMGADGREGARLLKQGGSTVWAQDEASCVIYGMPMAIVKANLADAVYSLDEIGKHLVEACV